MHDELSNFIKTSFSGLITNINWKLSNLLNISATIDSLKNALKTLSTTSMPLEFPDATNSTFLSISSYSSTTMNEFNLTSNDTSYASLQTQLKEAWYNTFNWTIYSTDGGQRHALCVAQKCQYFYLF